MVPSRRIALVVFLALVASACSESSSTAPTPRAPRLTFTPDTTAPEGQSVGITISSVPGPEGTLNLAVFAYNFFNDFRGTGNPPGVSSVYARIKWDGALLEVASAAPEAPPLAGDFLKQGGANAILCQPMPSSQSVVGSTLGICVRREPQTPPRASGNGEVYLFYLRARPNVTVGATAIHFIEGSEAYPQERVLLFPAGGVLEPNRHQRLDNYYGGTITIQ